MTGGAGRLATNEGSATSRDARPSRGPPNESDGARRPHGDRPRALPGHALRCPLSLLFGRSRSFLEPLRQSRLPTNGLQEARLCPCQPSLDRRQRRLTRLRRLDQPRTVEMSEDEDHSLIDCHLVEDRVISRIARRASEGGCSSCLERVRSGDKTRSHRRRDRMRLGPADEDRHRRQPAAEPIDLTELADPIQRADEHSCSRSGMSSSGPRIERSVKRTWAA